MVIRYMIRLKKVCVISRRFEYDKRRIVCDDRAQKRSSPMTLTSLAVEQCRPIEVCSGNSLQELENAAIENSFKPSS